MAEASGRDLVIKIDTGSGYVAIAGVRSKTVAINNEPVDISTDDDDGWRKLLPVPGQRGLDLSVSGVTKDQILCAEITAATSSITLQSVKLEYPDGSSYLGSYVLDSVTNNGEYNGAVLFDATLKSANLTGNLQTAWLNNGVTSAWLLDESSGPDLLPSIGSNNLTGGGGLTYDQQITGFSRTGINFSALTSNVYGAQSDFDTTGDSFSFTALIETGSTVTPAQRLCLVAGLSGVGFNLYIESGVLVFQNLGIATQTSALALSINTTYKVGCVMNGAAGTVDFYLNGDTEQKTGLTIDGDYGTFTIARIGSQDALSSYKFDGKMSCVAVSTTAQTAEQINAIFNSY